MRVADRVTVLRDGRNVGTVDRSESSVGSLISMILGRPVSPAAPHSPAATGTHEAVLLDVKGLTSDAFRSVDLQIGAGEVVGLYGAIGAGHFEAARALFGLYRCDGGTISVEGHVFPRSFTPRYAIRRGVAYAIESRRKSLFLDDAIYKNVTLPHLERIGRIAPTVRQELLVAEPAIRKVDVVPPDARNLAGKLSGGNQQKVALARWLTYPPKLLLVSEPTPGHGRGGEGGGPADPPRAGQPGARGAGGVVQAGDGPGRRQSGGGHVARQGGRAAHEPEPRQGRPHEAAMSAVEKPADPAAGGRRRPSGGRRVLVERFTALAPLWTLIVLCVVFGVGSDGSFLRTVNLNNILVQSSTLAILATGMTFVLLTGEIDLSIAAVMGLTGMIAARLYADAHLPEPWPVVLALLSATGLGLLNGLVSTRFRIPTFMSTLAMSMIADGLNQWISGGKTIFRLSPLVQYIGSARVGGEDSLLRVMTAVAVATLGDRLRGVPHVHPLRTLRVHVRRQQVGGPAGRHQREPGGGRLPDRLQLPGGRGRCGGGPGHLGSALATCSIPSFLIETIAAVVLGGTALTGGRGSIFLTAVGVLIYQTLRNGLDNIAGIDNFMKVFITGLVLLVALIVNVVFSGRRERDLA